MLEGLNHEERNLVISLTEKFLWIQESDYAKYFLVAFDSFVKKYNFIRGKNIYFCPLLPEDDFDKSKSSVYLIYSIKSHLVALQKKYSNFSITYADSPKYVDINIIKKNYTLCLIDDFIGTGETATKATKYFLDQEVKKDMMAIVSLVGMNFGISDLIKQGYDTYTGVCCEKGISYNYDKTQIEIMENIEKYIGVKDEYKFGYGSSEAIIRMKRTPNNTFPIFWLRNKKNPYAPFVR